MLLKTIALCTASTLVVAGGWFGRVIPFSEQWPMFEALRTTASIIFAVVGAWMAIIYPERLKLSIREPIISQNNEPTGMGKLFTPVVNSTAILCIILALGAASPILKRYPSIFDVDTCRGFSYALLITLTLWQLWTIILSLVPASLVKAYVDREDRVSATRSKLFQLTKKNEKPKS